MIPLIPGRVYVRRAAGDGLVFRRRQSGALCTHVLPNRMVYIGPHPQLPHLALFRSDAEESWYYWDIPESVIGLDDSTEGEVGGRTGGYRVTRAPSALWGRST